jgi:isopenicillin N synthase-like dioxygenase
MSLEPVSYALAEAEPEAFARKLGESFVRYGFAVVCDHGPDSVKVAEALNSAKSFFALPEAVKLAYRVPGGSGQRGYTPFRTEVAKGAELPDLKEFWHTGRETPANHPLAQRWGPNLWPAEVPGFRPAQLWLFESLDAMGARLLSAIARFLDLGPDYFDDAIAEGDSVLRLIHYPPTAGQTAGGVRAGAHGDINAITLLLGAEEGGLEVLTRDGDWLAINPPPGALVVNIGDMLSRLTNDYLPSTIHRVVNPPSARAGYARYSTPFFLHFRPDYLIRTLRSCISPDRPDRYPEPITAEAFLNQRLAEIGLKGG